MTDKTPEDILRELSEWCRNGTRNGQQFIPSMHDEVEQTAREHQTP